MTPGSDQPSALCPGEAEGSTEFFLYFTSFFTDLWPIQGLNLWYWKKKIFDTGPCKYRAEFECNLGFSHNNMGKDFLPSLSYKPKRKRNLFQKELSCPDTVFSCIVSTASVLHIFNMSLTTQGNMIPTHHTCRWSKLLPAWHRCTLFDEVCVFTPASVEHLQSLWKVGTGHLSSWSVCSDGHGAVVECRNRGGLSGGDSHMGRRGQSTH